jgi:putative two-component system response regulator
MASNDNPAPLLTRKTVLLVDDAPDNLVLVNDLLKDYYKIKIANSGERALRIAQAVPGPDLILLDIMMPEMDGYEVCRRLKANPATRHIPIIFLTAKTDADAERQGLDLGAVDYITKPISPAIAMARVRNHLLLKDSADFLRDQNEFLEREIASRTQEVMAIQDVTILAMASMAETRDSETGNHIRRTQHYVKALAQRLQDHPRFAATLTDQFIGLLYKSAPLHDIGKVGIPDRILLKPGRFEPHEMEIMKTHTTLGRDAIEHAERALGMTMPFLSLAKEIAYSHQEKWDGSGYPLGLAGEAIPVSARLMAVADVYDALISRRVYKEGMPHEQAVQIILDGKGKHFDPDMVDAFAGLLDEFRAIAARFHDSDADMAEKKEQTERLLGSQP